ncbi:MAG: OB-fold nucleic acid binding domain-containing protein [Candidatus Woesearchaeota archaeon]
MFNIPVSEVIRRIREKTSLSEKEIKDKINQKLESLSGLVSEEGAAHIVANELGIKLFDTSTALKIKNVLPGMRNVDITAKVIRIYDTKQFQTNGRSGQMTSALIGDETGTIRAVFWNKAVDNIKGLKETDVIKIISGYVRDNNGRSELHINDQSKILINPGGETVMTAGYSIIERKLIKDLNENDSNVEVLGTIVQVFEPRFFEICPSCKKRIKLKDDVFVCNTHGAVIPDYSYLISIYLDDGTSNIRTVFFRDQVQRLFNLSDTELIEFRENIQGFEQYKNELLGTIIKIRGRVNKNAVFERYELVVNYVDLNPDPEKEIENIRISKPQKEIKDTDEYTDQKKLLKDNEKTPVSDISFAELDLEELENIDDDFL